MAYYTSTANRMYERGDQYEVPPDPFYTDRYARFNGNISRENEPPVDYDWRNNKNRLQEDNDDIDASFDSEGKKKSIYRLWGRFADKTAMQGIAYIYSAKLWYAKLLWVILLLGAVAGMAFHLYYLIDQYLGFPVNTKIKLGFSNLPFPAVTICNTNVIRLSQLYQTSRELRELIELTKPEKFDPSQHANAAKRKKRFVDDFNDIDFKNFTGTEDYYDYFVDEDGNGPPPRDEQAELEDAFRQLFLELDRDTRIEIGHQIEDMLLGCSFDGYKCYASNFTVTNHAEFGNCFTLQSKSYKATNAGPAHGLTLALYMENEEYIPGISQGSGIRLVVHEQDSFSFPADAGVNIPPSFETHLGLKLTKIERIGKPYRNCTNGEEYRTLYNIKYTRMICQSACKPLTMFRRCGCYDEDDEELLYYFSQRKRKFCRTKKERRCMDKVNFENDKKAFTCVCENPCHEKKYTLYPSYRIWPTDTYARVLQESVCDSLPKAKCQRILLQSDPRSLNQNFLKISIYFEDLNYEELEETAEIEDAQFASDVGGAVGLWIGLSVLAVFELFQFLTELLAYGCHKCLSTNTKTKERQKRERKRKLAENTSTFDGPSEIKRGGFDNLNFPRPQYYQNR